MRDFEEFDPSSDDSTNVMQSNVDFGKYMRLEVNGEDIEEIGR